MAIGKACAEHNNANVVFDIASKVIIFVEVGNFGATLPNGSKN